MNVTAAVFYRDGNVLLMRRAQGHNAAGEWEYPGGKIEPGETGPEAIARELREELSIEPEIGELIAETTRVSGGKEIHLQAYKVISYSGEIKLSDHDAMEWVPIEKLLQHEQLPADMEISKQIVKGV